MTAQAFTHLVNTAWEKSAAQQWGEAADLWTQIVAENSVSGAFWTQLGLANLHAERYREAVPSFEKALELGGGFPAPDFEYGFPWRLAYDLARCHARLGENERALEELERALKLGYRDRAGIRTDESFASLHDDSAFRNLLGLPDVSAMTRDEGWRADLAFLVGEVKRLHYNPYRGHSPQVFDAFVKEPHDDIPNLTDVQVVLKVMGLMKRLGDGHSLVDGWDSPEFGDVPLNLYSFEEGLFVTAAAPEHADLVGSQVVGIGNHDVEEVMEVLEPLVSRDNAMWLKLIAPHFVRKPHLLHGLGMTLKPNYLPLTVRDVEGRTRQVELACAGVLPYPLPENWPTVPKQSTNNLPLYLRDDGPYWFKHLHQEKAVYIQHKSVSDKEEESFEQFCERLFPSVPEC